MLENLVLSFFISLGIQIVFFAFAAFFKTDKVTDLSYGLTFVVLAWILFVINGDFSLWSILLVFMVSAWGLRLAGFLFIRILKIKKDARFDGIREDPKRFAKFWFLQAVSIWIILLPVIVGLKEPAGSPNPISIFGLLVSLIGLSFESIADIQKFTFRNRVENKHGWIESGLWRYSRHPNYFGEILVWVGVFIYVAPLLGGLSWLSIVGPIYISFLLLFVTGIPPLEKSYEKKYGNNPDYQKYKKSTSILVPLPVKTSRQIV